MTHMKGGRGMETTIYERRDGLEVVNTARIRKLGIEKFAFETSFLGQPYETAMNMPMFDTHSEAEQWIESQRKWARKP